LRHYTSRVRRISEKPPESNQTASAKPGAVHNNNENNMDLPKFNETFLPILDVLKDGEIITGRELIPEFIE
jgi:hypothetical protein